MKKLFVGLCIALVLLVAVVLTLADEHIVVMDEMGSSHRSNGLPVSGTWKSAPQNPNTVYIAVYSPEKRFSTCVERALIKAVRAHGLKPVPAENISEYDLKGRIVVGYFTASTSGNILSREVKVSGILYYSCAGDVRSAMRFINSTSVDRLNNITYLKNLSSSICRTSLNRLVSMRIVNTSCTVIYWWNLRAEAGVLSGKDPYRMVANAIADQLNVTLNATRS